MTILLICLFVATLMPILAKAPLAKAMNDLKGGYNNKTPREQQKLLPGFGARAKAAHENSFEALIMFTPGALAVIATNSVGSMVEYLAIGFIIARLGYLLAYWFNIHVLRSSCWAVGFFISLGLILLSIP